MYTEKKDSKNKGYKCFAIGYNSNPFSTIATAIVVTLKGVSENSNLFAIALEEQ